ncbi:hypothetical protein P280DRAFT_465853 [Massarina eburnea CBS 473.64]|uniref:ER lumen protein retaining receptor n=1 Tax=Massarina eburnea CBS 473.64 TaxID=1395130 RepID=A0A6A6S9V6_9PLEO|nr:hypothetical protein P280DRAFT_465853 [Massarina eburnea CBS 473.64]
MGFNVFHILGDVSHTTSKLILIWAIHSNSSAEGVSLITQALYTLVFCSRYLDIFISSATEDWMHSWNFSLKIFYTLSSLYIIFLMTSVYARTREKEKAWKFGMYCLLGSIAVTPFWYLIFQSWVLGPNTFLKVMWVFSEILESVCVVPQLLLMRQTTVPTVIDSFYLVALATYRFLYILNWINRGAKEGHVDPTSWVWGTIQTALMIDFAWVYYTRQRVKLRRGGVVDSDDLSRGWLVGRFAGRKSVDFDFEEEENAHRRDQRDEPPKNAWGRRGISVSADEGVRDAPRLKSPNRNLDPEAQPLADPAAFEDEDSDDGLDAPALAGASGAEHESGVRGDEWNDDVDADAQEHSGLPK